MSVRGVLQQPATDLRGCIHAPAVVRADDRFVSWSRRSACDRIGDDGAAALPARDDSAATKAAPVTA